MIYDHGERAYQSANAAPPPPSSAQWMAQEAAQKMVQQQTVAPDMATLSMRLAVLCDHLAGTSGELIGVVSRVYGEDELNAVGDRDKPTSAGALGELMDRLSHAEALAQQIAAKVQRLSSIA